MPQFLFAISFFILGYMLCKVSQTQKFNKVVLSTARLLEINLYVALKDYIEMNNYGIRALDLIIEKISDDSPEIKDEYKKIRELYVKKINHFANFYISNMKQFLPYEIKYKTFKEVKEAFNMLFIEEEKK